MRIMKKLILALLAVMPVVVAASEAVPVALPVEDSPVEVAPAQVEKKHQRQRHQGYPSSGWRDACAAAQHPHWAQQTHALWLRPGAL